MKTILDKYQLQITIERLAYQLIENYSDLSSVAIIGIQPRGIFLSDKIFAQLKKIIPGNTIDYGKMDITFYRDDFRKKELIPNETNIDFTIEDKNVIIVDDVLFTGRTIRAGLDAMLAFGRPKDVELLVLVDRRFSRNLPIQAKYTGIVIDSIDSQNVKVEWKESDKKDKVSLLDRSK